MPHRVSAAGSGRPRHGVFASLIRAYGFRPALGTPPRADRKSTRLNSSHSQISYAVFCLKKKNREAALVAGKGHPGGRGAAAAEGLMVDSPLPAHRAEYEQIARRLDALTNVAESVIRKR